MLLSLQLLWLTEKAICSLASAPRILRQSLKQLNSAKALLSLVNKIVDKLPRVDIPGDWVDYVIQSPKPFYIEPLFTRDPALITDAQVLKGMMAIKGIYGEYQVESMNHGIGFDTAAIELLLPTYGEELGTKGKICKNFI